MIKDIQQLITQITDFLSDKDGFGTEVSENGCVVKVTNADSTEIQYDGYELLLYTLSTRKLGHDIDLNIHETENGKVFAINTEASLELRDYMTQINTDLATKDHGDDVLSVVVCDQTSEKPHPYCVLTLFKNGNWLRQDLTMAEILYAATHELVIEKEENAYVYTKLRVLAKQVIDEIQEIK